MQRYNQYKVEHDTYPELRKIFERRGFMFQRIEGSLSVPDIFVCNSEKWYWIEVKMYRGTKPLDTITTANRLSWKPGQLRFRHDMRKSGNINNYMLIICDGNNFREIVGGLDRC